MNEMTKAQNEAANIGREAQGDAGFAKMLKFKTGDYWCDNEEVAKGTQFIAHCPSWTKTWVHFENKQVVERKIYRIAMGERALEREQLPNNEPETWPKDPNGRPMDPWALQYLLPFENPQTFDINIFVGGSFGSRRAIADLCTAWANRSKRMPGSGNPIIKLGVTTFPTKNWGDVKRPMFEIVGWEGEQPQTTDPKAAKQIDMEAVAKKAQFDDEIPF